MKRVNYFIAYSAPDSLLNKNEGRDARDYFTVKFHSTTVCSGLSVTIGDDGWMPDVTYLASTSASAVVMDSTATFTVANAASCTNGYAYAIRRLGTGEWWALTDVAATTSAEDFNTFMAIDSAGVISITVNSASGLAPISGYNPAIVYEVRITYGETTLSFANSSATQIFLLTVKDKCMDNVITCSGAVDITHTIPDA